ncbi:hypothetical protein OG226_22490 [Streptomyces sp. NBC_01261]|uniref:hypothetical protein n=1 Tax=Streptomyces sp. NBC_01261 TaxID=2903802 RepID=UPI002E35BD15|nr:hypothetical protein [Streptomyces sp. NBC_01261]
MADLHLRAMTDPAAAGERRLGARTAKAPTRELPLPRFLGRFNPQTPESLLARGPATGT